MNHKLLWKTVEFLLFPEMDIKRLQIHDAKRKIRKLAVQSC